MLRSLIGMKIYNFRSVPNMTVSEKCCRVCRVWYTSVRNLAICRTFPFTQSYLLGQDMQFDSVGHQIKRIRDSRRRV